MNRRRRSRPSKAPKWMNSDPTDQQVPAFPRQSHSTPGCNGLRQLRPLGQQPWHIPPEAAQAQLQAMAQQQPPPGSNSTDYWHSQQLWPHPPPATQHQLQAMGHQQSNPPPGCNTNGSNWYSQQLQPRTQQFWFNLPPATQPQLQAMPQEQPPPSLGSNDYNWQSQQLQVQPRAQQLWPNPPPATQPQLQAMPQEQPPPSLGSNDYNWQSQQVQPRAQQLWPNPPPATQPPLQAMGQQLPQSPPGSNNDYNCWLSQQLQVQPHAQQPAPTQPPATRPRLQAMGQQLPQPPPGSNTNGSNWLSQQLQVQPHAQLPAPTPPPPTQPQLHAMPLLSQAMPGSGAATVMPAQTVQQQLATAQAQQGGQASLSSQDVLHALLHLLTAQTKQEQRSPQEGPAPGVTAKVQQRLALNQEIVSVTQAPVHHKGVKHEHQDEPHAVDKEEESGSDVPDDSDSDHQDDVCTLDDGSPSNFGAVYLPGKTKPDDVDERDPELKKPEKPSSIPSKKVTAAQKRALEDLTARATKHFKTKAAGPEPSPKKPARKLTLRRKSKLKPSRGDFSETDEDDPKECH